jgi:hypothetical protein
MFDLEDEGVTIFLNVGKYPKTERRSGLDLQQHFRDDLRPRCLLEVVRM